MTPSPLPYFVKAAVIWQRYLQTSNSNNLIFAFFVFSLPLPPPPTHPSLCMSQCSPKISQDIKSDIQCPPLKWSPFWPLPPPRAPLPQTSLFTQQKYLILEWQQKNSAKTTYYHHHLLFLANPKQKTEKFLSNLKW